MKNTTTARDAAMNDLLWPLLAGLAAAAAIWWAGAPGWSWLGFASAGMVWAGLLGSGRRPPLPASARVGPEPPDPSPVILVPGSYALDPDRSTAHFTVRKLGLFPVHGRLTRVSGTVELSQDRQCARVAASVPAAALDTGNGRRDRHVLSPSFLDAAHHPELHFQSAEVVDAASGRWAVLGVLTVRGAARPVSLSVRLRPGRDGRYRLVAETEIRRSAFGVGAMRWLVADPVRVTVEVEAVPR